MASVLLASQDLVDRLASAEAGGGRGQRGENDKRCGDHPCDLCGGGQDHRCRSELQERVQTDARWNADAGCEQAGLLVGAPTSKEENGRNAAMAVVLSFEWPGAAPEQDDAVCDVVPGDTVDGAASPLARFDGHADIRSSEDGFARFMQERRCSGERRSLRLASGSRTRPDCAQARRPPRAPESRPRLQFTVE